MRIMTMLFITLILGGAGIGALMFVKSEMPSVLEGKVTELEASGPVQSKWREAPFVTLAPSQTLPEKQSAAPPPPPPPLPAKPKAQTPRVATAPAPQSTQALPKAALPKAALPKAPPATEARAKNAISSIAKLALETVIGPQETQKTSQPKTVRTEPEPLRQAEPKKITPQKLAKATPPPPLSAPAIAPAAPAPAKHETFGEKKQLQLLYETKSDSRAETIKKRQSELAKGQIRFPRAVPVSSGTLKSEKMTIKLAGVDALIADAKCKYASGKSWECGRWGKYALRRLIRGRSVVCDVIEQVSEEKVMARCKVAGVDINQWVVRRGWGSPAGGENDKYDVALKAAKDDRLGQWSKEIITKQN